MKETVSFHRFKDVFMEMRPNNFSYEGLQALYRYLLDLEGDMGEELELDVVALCIEFSEFSTIEEFNTEYGKDYKSYVEIEETTVIPVNNKRFIIQNY